MKRTRPFLLALLCAHSAQAWASSQGLYEQCQTDGTSDDACHRQTVQAGGTVASSTYAEATVAPTEFFGRDQYSLWYRNYQEWCWRREYRPYTMDVALPYYPGYPLIRHQYQNVFYSEYY